MPTKSKTSETWTVKWTSWFSNKNNTNVIVKKRKAPLKPTKASAAAITLQANRAKKQALIEKLANEEPHVKNWDNNSKKIPLWVWIFFGCSLFLFCVSFYKAVIYPKLDVEVVRDNDSTKDTILVEESEELTIWWNEIVAENGTVELVSESGVIEGVYENDLIEEIWEVIQNDTSFVMYNWTEQERVINSFFELLSNQDFDGMMSTMNWTIKNSDAIKVHFAASRMKPFLWGIEWNRLLPENIRYITSSTSWKETYQFNISYIISSTYDRYDEEWEVVVDQIESEWKIVRLNCVTPWCSKHPIFWPEKVGLL